MIRGNSFLGRVVMIGLVACCLAAATKAARACECVWAGPFLSVQSDAPILIRAKVLSYHGNGKYSKLPLAMDVELHEVLRGDVPEGTSLRIWGDDGHLCRPYVTRFPIGSEWILALNGPGSKPGMSPGPSISACGEYWLEVKGEMAAGNIDGPAPDSPKQERRLAELRSLLVASPAGSRKSAAPGDSSLADVSAGRMRVRFGFEVAAADSVQRAFGPGFFFQLVPTPLGWRIEVKKEGRDEDLARLTPPFHSVPNPRDIEGWHFRNADNTGPNEAGEKNVNAPGEIRGFIFSPEVGRTIQGPDAKSGPTAEEIAAVGDFGTGRLTVLEFRLTEPRAGEQAAMIWMRGEVEIEWRAGSE
jgi:hypothetical protein